MSASNINTISRGLLMIVVVVMTINNQCNGLNIKIPSNSIAPKTKTSVPILNNSTDVYYQDYMFLGGECKVSALSRVTLSPIYKASESCIKTKDGSYQKSYCTSRGFVTERDCLEDCTQCSGKSEDYLFPQCTKEGIASIIRMCGKILIEDLPKVLWNVEYDNCESKKIIKAKGSVADTCEWSLFFEPWKVMCNSTDYSMEKYTGSFNECKTRIGVSHGRVNSCEDTTEYKCQ